MRFTVEGRTTNAPTATLPGASIYGTAAMSPKIVEIGVFNTTTTACMVNVAYLTTAGTQGSGLTETIVSNATSTTAAICTVVQSHTSTPPTLGNGLVRASLGAAIGAGMVWTFDQVPITPPLGTANGVGLLCFTGTGQVLDFYIIWDE